MVKEKKFKIEDYHTKFSNKIRILKENNNMNDNNIEGMINIDDNFNLKRPIKDKNTTSNVYGEELKENQDNFEENNEFDLSESFQSDTFKHLHFHKKHPVKMIQRSRSLLAPIFHKSTNEVINDWYRIEGGEMTSSNRDKYYKKQEEKFLQHAKQIKFEDDQSNMLLLPPKPPKIPLFHSTFNFMEDDPLAKYNLRDLMIEERPKSCKIERRKQNFTGHDSNCVDCNRFQIKIKHLEGQLGDYRKLQKQSVQLKAEQIEKKRLADYVNILEVKRNPINKLNARVNQLEQKNIRLSKYNNTIMALEEELNKTRECNQWFYDKIKVLENRL